MLSAQKEDKRVHAVGSASSLSTLNTVGKVVSSIHGLQQRLEEFTDDDVNKADENAKTLTRGLAELQRKLESLAEIKRSITAARLAVEQTPPLDVNFAELESLDKPLQLKSILQASNLIRFRRSNKTTKEEGKPSPINTAAKIGQLALYKTEKAGASLQSSQNNEVPRVEQSLRASEIEIHATVTSDIEAENKATKAPDQEKVGAAKFLHVDQPKTVVSYTAIEKPPLESPLNTEKQGAKTRPPSTISNTKEPEPQWETNHFVATSRRMTDPDDAKALVPVSTDFDQRLLDDLIKNYGEFATAPNLPATVSPSKNSIAKSINQKTTNESQEAEKDSAKKHLPILKKEGDLDRKLKKLIKDYGEYDLYSRRSPVNLKTGVIAAFLLLAIVFSGFYFFSSSKRLVAPHASPVAQSPSDASHGSTLRPKDKDSASGSLVGDRGATSADLHRSVEAREPRPASSVTNKTLMKQKK